MNFTRSFMWDMYVNKRYDVAIGCRHERYLVSILLVETTSTCTSHFLFWGHNHTTVMQLSCTVKGTNRTLPYGYPVMETSNPAHTSPPKLTCYVVQIHSCWPEYEHQYWMQVILTSAHSTTLEICDSLHANSLCSVLTDSQPHCQWHCMWTGTRDGGQHKHIY